MISAAWQKWLRSWLRRRRPRPCRLRLESLEARLAPAAWAGDVFDTAPGTANQPITLTSILDNAAAGSSNSAKPGDPTGLNGNLSTDPRYFNRADQQYDLRAGSPAIDAGTSVNAPTTDFLGNPRYGDPQAPNTGAGPHPNFERQANPPSGIDLATTVVSGPASAVEGDKVTATYTVKNQGTSTAAGSWQDAVYLSTDPIWSPDDLLVGQVPHTGDVGPGLTYDGSAQVTLPGVLPGNYSFIVRADASNDVVEAPTDLPNNALAAATTTALNVPALTLGTAQTGKLSADGASQVYKVVVPAGGDLSVALTGPADASHELYLACGDVPSRQRFDARSATLASPNQSVSVGSTQAGTYYVLVYGVSVPADEAFTLTAVLSPFGLTRIAPAQGSNTGPTTILFTGAQFTAASQPRLIDKAGSAIQPSAVYFTDSGHLAATFDLAGRPVGAADAVVDNGGGAVATLHGAFQVIAGQPGQFAYSLSLPGSARVNGTFPILINYSNTGDTDLLAPVLQLSGPDTTQLSLSTDFSLAASSLQLVAVSPSGPAGILAPGAQGRILVYGRGSAAATATFNLQASEYPATPIDWAALEPTIRPAGLTDAQWDAFFAQIQAVVGTSWDDYRAAVANAATLLPARRGLSASLSDDFALIADQARAALNTSVGGSVQHAGTEQPLGNVGVELLDPSSNTLLETISNTDGSFLFSSVPAGSYTVKFLGYAAQQTTPLVVGTSSLSNMTLQAIPGAVLSGGVVLAGVGSPLANVLVSAVLPDGTSTSAMTAADGTFTIDSLAPGTYTLMAGNAPYTDAARTGLALATGAIEAHQDFALAVGGTVSGTVTGPGGPVAGASVVAVADDGASGGAVTAADGTFAIAGLPTDTYTITARAPNLIPAARANVAVQPGASVQNISFALTTGGSVAGKLTFPDATAAAGVSVVLTGQGVALPTSTDGSGAFFFSGLAPGAYTVTVQGDSIMTVTAPANVTAGSAVPVTVTTAQRGSIAGTITNATSGKPLANVTVYVTNDQGLIGSSVTDATGAYVLDALDAGSYVVHVGDTNTPGVAQRQATLSVGHPTATVSLGVIVAGTIAGTVFQADGVTPLAGAVVSLAAGQHLLDTVTRPDGTYAFVLVKAGTYALRVRTDGADFPGINNLLVSSGTSLTGQNFTAGHETIQGLVQDATSHAVLAGATVSITLVDPAVALPLTVELLTGDDGHYTFSGALPGDYTISAGAPGHAAATTALTVHGGTAADGSLALAVGRALTGTVRDAGTGKGIAGVLVSLRSPSGPVINDAALSDATGHFVLAGVPDGTYTFSALASGYQTTLVQDLQITKDTAQDLSLSAATTDVRGTVTTGAVGLRGVFVTATDASGIVFAEASTDAAGAYDLNSLPAGTYTLVASAPGYRDSMPAVVTVTAGQQLTSMSFTVIPIALTDPAAGTDARIAARSPGLDYASFIQDPSVPAYDAERLSAQTALDATTPRGAAYIAAKADGVEADLVALGAYDDLVSDYNLMLGALNAYGAGTSFGLLTTGPVETAIAQLDKVAPGAANAALAGFDQGELNEALFTQGSTYNGDWPAKQAALQRVVGSGVLPRLADALVAKKVPNAGFYSVPVQSLQARLIERLDEVKVLLDYQEALTRYNANVQMLDDKLVFVKSEPPLPRPLDPPQQQTGCAAGCMIGTVAVPNSVDGTSGFGTQNYDQAGDASNTMNFQNSGVDTSGRSAGDLATVAPATVPARPAQKAIVTQTLDQNLDLSTLQFTTFGWGSNVYTVPAGLSHYQTTIDLRPQNVSLLIRVTLDVNATTRVLTATFASIDPLTGQPPDNLSVGFLPANDPTTHDGEGFVNYFVRPKANLATGTQIHNQATITFDARTPIVTPTTLTTLDVGAPTSTVASLPKAEAASTFPVSWSGSDDSGGSGIRAFDVYVSDSGGPLTLWLSGTTQTSASYPGKAGHSYGFFSVATDNVGNRQATPARAQASTNVAGPVDTSIGLASDHKDGAVYAQVVQITAIVTAGNPTAGTPTGTVQLAVDGHNVGSPVNLAAGQARIGLPVLPAGTHAVTATYSSAAALFTGSTTTAPLTQVVNPALLTITADNQTKAYGAAVPALSVHYVGFVNGESAANLTTAPTLSSTATAASNVGSYPTTASGAVDPNYTISYVPAILKVTPVPLSVTAENQTSIYGAALPALTVHYAGFVNGDSAASLTTAPTLATTAKATSKVGSYPITAGGAADPNYTITFAPGTLKIAPAPLTVTADDRSKAYGAVLPALAVHYAGFVNGDNAASLTTAPTLTTTATAASGVGSYPITVAGATDPNYTVAFAPGTLKVTPVPLTISADDQTMVYGADLPTLTVHYAGFVNGDSAAGLTTAPSVTTTATAASAVGSYPIAPSGAVDPNYIISFVPGTLAITPAPLTIAADDQTKAYGAALLTLTVHYVGFVNGDSAASLTTAPSVATTATAASAVGSYPITVGSAVDANYTIAFAPGTLAITPAPLTITADDQTKVYGADLPALTIHYAGFVNGDSAASLTTAPTVATTATAAGSVGSYPIMATGAVDPNYIFSFAPGTLTVTPAPFTTTADDQTKAYGDDLPSLTVHYAGFVNGDGAASLTTAPTVATTATATSHADNYPITAGSAVDPNYTINYAAGTLTITAVPLTISVDDQTKAYGADLPSLTVHYAGFVNGDTAASLTTAPAVSTTASAASAVGSYPITANGAVDADYTISFAPGTLTVTPVPLTITADDQTAVAGGPLPKLAVHFAGFVNGDSAATLTASPLVTTSATTGSPAGRYPIAVSGAASPNYTIRFIQGTLTLTPPASSASTSTSNVPAASVSQDAGTAPLSTTTASGSTRRSAAMTTTAPSTPVLQITAPTQVKAHGRVVSFPKAALAIHAQNARALLKVRLTTSAGRLMVHAGKSKTHVHGSNSRVVNLTGTAADVNKVLHSLTLLLDTPKRPAKLHITASDGSHKSQAAIAVIR